MYKKLNFLSTILIKVQTFNIHFKRKELYILLIIGIFSSSFFSVSRVTANKFNQAPNYILIITGILLASTLLILTLFDIFKMHILKSICIIGTLLGFISTGILGASVGREKASFMIIDHVLAAVSALIMMKCLSTTSRKILKKEALGLGDAQLASMGGAWLGIKGITFAICLSFTTAGFFSFIGLLTKKLHPSKPFPFGPFVSASIWLMWLFEPNWWVRHWLSLWGI